MTQLRTLSLISSALFIGSLASGQVSTISQVASDSGFYDDTGAHDPNVENVFVGNYQGTNYAGFAVLDGIQNSQDSGVLNDQLLNSMAVRVPSQDRSFSPSNPVAKPFAWRIVNTYGDIPYTTTTNYDAVVGLEIERGAVSTTDDLQVREYNGDIDDLQAGGSGQTAIYNELSQGASTSASTTGETINVPLNISLSETPERVAVGFTLQNPDNGEFINLDNIQFVLSGTIANTEYDEPTDEYMTQGHVFYTDSAIIPEPGTYAAVAGIASLGLVLWRKRRRQG